MKSVYLRFFLLSFGMLFLTEVFKTSLKLDTLIYNSLVGKMTETQIQEFFKLENKWLWINYIFFPIILLIKICTITSVIYIGHFFLIKNDLSFKSVFNLVINAEFIFLLIPIIKIFWFCFIQPNYNLETVQYFYPLSALNIIGYKGLESWLIYPLQTLNLFEFVYIIYLSYQIGNLTKTNADTGLKIVASSYVPALLLWVSVVMFFTLNYSL